MNEIINGMLDKIMLHTELMDKFHLLGLQGIKRFNRYESKENMERFLELRNYQIEYNKGTYTSSEAKNYTLSDNVINLIDNIVNDRLNTISKLSKEYKNTDDVVYASMLLGYIKDFQKEYEVFNRLKEKLSKINDVDNKWLVLFDFDKEMHDYIKDKED